MRVTDHADRVKLFDRLATEWYGTDRYGEMMKRDLNVGKATVMRWKVGTPIPEAVIMLLEAWIEVRGLDAEIAQLKERERAIAQLIRPGANDGKAVS
jgi:hypothetical protein